MRIDALIQSQSISLSNVSAILDRANAGDIIRAQILKIAADEIILKLFDGSTLSASISDSLESLEARQGEFVDFRVKEKLDSKILLELIKNFGIKDFENGGYLNKQVKALGINPDTENMEIAKELKSSNIPLNKENFGKMLDIISGFKDINPAKAAFLIANKLGIEEKNITALKQLTDEKVKISQSIGNLLNSLETINDEVLIKDIANSMINSNKADISSNTQVRSLEMLKSEALLDKIINMAGEMINAKSPLNISQDDIMNFNKISKFFDENKLDITSLKEKFSSFIERNFNSQSSLFLAKQENTQVLINNIMSILSKNENDDSTNKLLNDLTGNSPKVDDYKKEIKSIFDKLHITINSDGLKDDLNVKNLYKELYIKLEAMKETLEASTLPNKTEIISIIEHTENNIRFMNQLNSYSNYVQIPLNIWDKNTTGEVYVLKRGSRKRKIDPENATMLISLNTENLGQIDTFLNVNKKNISISMRVENNNLIEFIKGYHKDLYNRMNEKGYKLVDLKFRIPEEDICLTNVNKLAEREFSPGKVSIDCRL